MANVQLCIHKSESLAYKSRRRHCTEHSLPRHTHSSSPFPTVSNFVFTLPSVHFRSTHLTGSQTYPVSSIATRSLSFKSDFYSSFRIRHLYPSTSAASSFQHPITSKLRSCGTRLQNFSNYQPHLTSSSNFANQFYIPKVAITYS